MTGGKYLAEERGAFEPEPTRDASVDAVAEPVHPARAPLYEAAAVHDGQPPVAWLGLFYRWFAGNE